MSKNGTHPSEKHGGGLFELPLFNYSTKRKLERLGVVDVGSNSVRLVVFDGAARSPAYFFNEKILCGLGAGISETGKLNPKGRARALSALKRFVLLAKNMGAEPIYSVATAAVRDATDGPEFCGEVLAETGLRLNVASGGEEARLSAQGVLLGWPDARGLMCDIGGASMELAEIRDGEVRSCVTSPLGPLKLATFEAAGTLQKEITKGVARLRKAMGARHDCLFLVGGSWRALARLDMARRAYPLKVLHEYSMSPENAMNTADWIERHPVSDLRAMTGSSVERMKLVPIAAKVLRELIHQFQPESIAVSSYGIREGLLYEQMPKSLRKRDPLIEACIHMERASARNPGFGKVLNGFLAPLFYGETDAQKRLIKAACLLHDVNWRTHPDYRSDACFDYATRSNLGGLDHRGRIFLGTALLQRYKNSKNDNLFDDVIALLCEEDRKSASVLGKAMRFGAMLSGASDQMECALRFSKQEKILELNLARKSADLFGEVVQSRFESLAKALECETKLTIA